MKRILTIALSALLICAALLTLASCGKKIRFGKEYVAASSMVDVLMQLNAKSIDVGIMDSIMASYYMSQDSQYANNLMIIPDLTLADEQYGIAGRKNSGLIKKINEQLIALTKDGTVAEIAGRFGLTNDVCIDQNATVAPLTATEEEDWNYICSQGKVIIGYTDFKPIAYTENNTLTGFDIELARKVCEKLGLEAEFVVIDWDQKEAMLTAKTIDCIWNALTITDERKAAMEISIPYMNNKQVAVIRKEDKTVYTSVDTMGSAIIGAEAGSAGEECVVITEEN